MRFSEEAFALAAAWADDNDSDVVIFSGEIRPVDADDFVKEGRARVRKRKNVLLLVITPGGSADAAYRLGRWLQVAYQDGLVRVWVTGWCKSAGTLLAVSGNELIIGDVGELGPLDVQLSKSDELFEWNSGLIIDSALSSLQGRAITMFEQYFMRIMARSAGRVTFKTATSIAANMVTSLLGPVYSQIDPIKIGENAREMSVASDYGVRLNEQAQNLRSRKSLDTLVQSYCSHGFVIDRKEAAKLFDRVLEPDAKLQALETALGEAALVPSDPTSFGYLSDAEEENETEHDQATDAGASSRVEPESDAGVIRADFGRAAEKSDIVALQAPSSDRDIT